MENYKNFKAVIYCPVSNLINITDFEKFSNEFDWIEKHIKVGKVYLETYRKGTTIERGQMERIIDFFKRRGIETSGGITTDEADTSEGGFNPFCYTNPDTIKLLTEVVEFTASLFDEIMLDDFYFTNCRCDSCIKEKKDRTWAEFRIELKKNISKKVVVESARKVNPKVKMIIKYPNWYEHYQDSGYNLEDESQIFDAIYTGTETRNPSYTQQHLPKYLSYFIMRYLENVAPGRNGGGWYDPFECYYNLTSYAEQAYLTLFGKPKEVLMFALGALLHPDFSLCAPINGQIFTDMDKYLGELGNPVGTACYLPYHSHGEDYLHNFIGMLGIPLEPYPYYPKDADTIFLTESATKDTDILNKMMESLRNGADVIVTSGFVKEAAKLGFQKHLCNISYTGRKASVNSYGYSTDGGVRFGGLEESAKSIIIPQLEYMTNDAWKIVAGFGEDNGFPLFLKTKYGKGRLYVLTIPEDYGDLYNIPRKALLPIRQVFQKNSPILFDTFAKVGLFTYDNDSFAIHSFQPWYDEAVITLRDGYTAIKDLVSGKTIKAELEGKDMVVRLRLSPGNNYAYKLLKE